MNDTHTRTTSLHIGFDDTDSAYGGCTTSLATEIINMLIDLNVTFLDFPNLIRLNPNIPYKTRGNGSIAIRIKIKRNKLEIAKRNIIELMDQYSRITDDNVNPGLIFIEDTIPHDVEDFVEKALTKLIGKSEVLEILDNHDIEYYEWNAGRGLVGGLGAIGYPLRKRDYTFELLAYREYTAFEDRKIDMDSIYAANREFYTDTFSNLDKKYGRIMIIPNGPDPVFAGIRGETPEAVLNFWNALKPKETIRDIMIFRTNQGTNAHIPSDFVPINKLEPYMSAKIKGKIRSKPKTLVGGHTRFKFSDSTGEIWCYAYEPTKDFRDNVLKLDIGDQLQIFGGIRPPDNEYPMCMNMENIITDQLIPRITRRNPQCPYCSKSLTSKGKNKGYYCKNCNEVWPNFKKIKIRTAPPFDDDHLLLPPISAHRHLTKPIKRYGKEKTIYKEYQYDKWIYEYRKSGKFASLNY